MTGDWLPLWVFALAGSAILWSKMKKEQRNIYQLTELVEWPAPGSEDTELGVLMELEVGHGETEVYPGVQA